MTLARVQTLYDDQKNEGDAMAESVHQELVGLSTDIATMSQEFFESKRGTKAMQQRIDGQVGQLQEAAREHDTRYQGLRGQIEGLEDNVGRTYQDVSLLLAQRGAAGRPAAKAMPVPGVSAGIARTSQPLLVGPQVSGVVGGRQAGYPQSMPMPGMPQPGMPGMPQMMRPFG